MMRRFTGYTIGLVLATTLCLLGSPGALAQQATVLAEVKLDDGSPVAGAQVLAVPTSAGKAQRQAKTKKSGTTTIPFLEFGSYRFRAEKKDLLMKYVKVRVLWRNQEETAWESEIGPLQEVPEFQIQPGREVFCEFTLVSKDYFAAGLTIPGDQAATQKFEEANRLSNDGQYAESSKLLEEIVETGEATANVYYVLGRNAFALKQYDDAEKWLVKTLEVNPAQKGAAAQLGSIAYERGDREAALGYFARELENSPDMVAVAINMGVIQAELGRVDEAIATFEKVIEMSPGDPASYSELAALYMEREEYGKAQQLLQKMEEFARPDPALWFNIGATFSNRDQYEEAAAAYQKALEIDPDFADAHRELGYLKVREGKQAEALQHFAQYLEMRPDAPDADEVRAVRDALAKAAAGS